MRRKKPDVLEMLSVFQRKVLNNKPAYEKMFDEVRMMRFKVKPVQGDISLLNLKNNNFIEMLWGLGKLDEFYQDHVQELDSTQKTTFFRIFDEMYQRFQDQLNNVDLDQDKSAEKPIAVEMEIFKERSTKSN